MLSPEAMTRLSRDRAEVIKSGMVALVPQDEDIERLNVPGGEVPSILHTTLFFLGGGLSEDSQTIVRAAIADVAKLYGPIASDAWASCLFNPNGDDPCATYLVGGQELSSIHSTVDSEIRSLPIETPEQHTPWIPHITIGYGMMPSKLIQHGPLVFDRLRVAFGDENVTDFFLESPVDASRT